MQISQTETINNQHKFGDIAKIKNGYAFKKSDFIPNGVPLIRQSNLGGDHVDFSGCIYLPESYLEKYKAFALKKGDVLLGMSGSLGKICFYNSDEPALQNQRTGKIDIIHPERVTDRYFWYFLNTIESKLIGLSKGTGVNNVSAKDIESLDIYLPPIEYQNKVTKKLDSYIPRIEASRKNIVKSRRLTQLFRQSVLAAAVTGKLTEKWRKTNGVSQKWEIKTLKEISIFVTDGDHNPPKRVTNGVPYLTAKNIKNGTLFFNNCTFVTSKDAEKLYKRYKPNKGDIIVTCVGTLGETAIVKKETFTADRNLAIIRPNNLASSDYIKLYLDSPIVKNKLLVGSGSSAQPHLYLTDLRAFKITLPSKEEQQIIVDRVSKLFDIAVKIENKTEAANANINKLTQSILAKAFRGQL